jgi:hypothetical protein
VILKVLAQCQPPAAEFVQIELADGDMPLPLH